MTDSWRRILEQQEVIRRATESHADLQRKLDPLAEAMKNLGQAPDVLRFLREEDDRRKLLADMVGQFAQTRSAVQKILDDAEQQRKFMEGPLEGARRLGLLDRRFDAPQALLAALNAQAEYEKLFRLPAADEITRLARDAKAAADLGRLAYHDVDQVESLHAAMQAMQRPWLNIEHVDHSARAFAELQAIGRALTSNPPYAEQFASSLRQSLGDWRDVVLPVDDVLAHPVARLDLYRSVGVDSALTDFTALAFEEAVARAGLSESSSETEELEDEGFALAREAFDELQRFEQAIRRFIERVMQAAFGDKWMKHRLPANMLDRWIAKRDVALKAGESEQPLIDYADFSDYRQIIERGDNWREVFKSIFGRAEDVRESFQRLQPVRIATMHARIITTDDRLLLIVETKRVLRAVRNAG